MKYDHRVKVDGKWFNAGVEVEVKASAPVKKEEPKDVQPETEEPKAEAPTYSRTDIQQMNKEKLIEVATSLGFEVNEDNKVNDLKGMILGKLGI